MQRRYAKEHGKLYGRGPAPIHTQCEARVEAVHHVERTPAGNLLRLKCALKPLLRTRRLSLMHRARRRVWPESGRAPVFADISRAT